MRSVLKKIWDNRKVTANAFEKTRRDHSDETLEDVTELIYRLSGASHDTLAEDAQVRTAQLVEALGVSQPTVTKMLNRLEREGVVHIHRRQYVHLTDDGLAIARQSAERHAMVVTFLRSLGVSELTAELDAEGIEHHLSPETIECIRGYLAVDGRRA